MMIQYIHRLTLTQHSQSLSYSVRDLSWVERVTHVTDSVIDWPIIMITRLIIIADSIDFNFYFLSLSCLVVSVILSDSDSHSVTGLGRLRGTVTVSD